uniref:Uncharacterized protein n=1 Tax=Daucus carota subsp. sativus TaxID=79200 RepID=A0A164SY98_DAUCS
MHHRSPPPPPSTLSLSPPPAAKSPTSISSPSSLTSKPSPYLVMVGVTGKSRAVGGETEDNRGEGLRIREGCC